MYNSVTVNSLFYHKFLNTGECSPQAVYKISVFVRILPPEQNIQNISHNYPFTFAKCNADTSLFVATFMIKIWHLCTTYLLRHTWLQLDFDTFIS